MFFWKHRNAFPRKGCTLFGKSMRPFWKKHAPFFRKGCTLFKHCLNRCIKRREGLWVWPENK